MRITKEFFLMSPDPAGIPDPNGALIQLFGAHQKGCLKTSRILSSHKEALLKHGLDPDHPPPQNEEVAAKLAEACGWKKMPRIFLLTITVLDQTTEYPERKLIKAFDLIKTVTDEFLSGTTFNPKHEYLLSFFNPYNDFPETFEIILSESEYQMLMEAGKHHSKLDFQFQEIPPEQSKEVQAYITTKREIDKGMKRTAYPQNPK